MPSPARTNGSAAVSEDPAAEPEAQVTVAHCIAEDYDGLALSHPVTVFLDPVMRELYVTDSGHGRIVVYTDDFYPLFTMGTRDGLDAPVDVAVAPDGTLYVLQRAGKGKSRARISVYSPALYWKRDIHFRGFDHADTFQPVSMVLGSDGRIYLAGGDKGIVVLESSGAYSHTLAPRDALGKGEPRNAHISDLARDDEGRLYLLSEEMGRVYVYDAQENFLFKFGQKGGGAGKLSRPRGIAVDNEQGQLYVIDYMRHTANVYDLSGSFLYEFGGRGWSPGWFQFPSDIVVDGRGRVIVADTFNNRVQVFQERRTP